MLQIQVQVQWRAKPPKDLPPEAGPSAGSNLEQPLSQPQNMKASVYWWKILSLDDLLDSKSNCENVTEKGTRIGLDKHGNPLVLTMQLKYTASLSLPLNPHMMSFLSVCLYVSFQSMHLWKYIFDKMAENYDYPLKHHWVHIRLSHTHLSLYHTLAPMED